MLQRLALAIKGGLMGVADMVPGVSGGTVALIVGVYQSFIDALRSLHLGWLPPLARWVTSGFRRAEARDAFAAQWRTMHVGFLLNLGLGIAVALVAMVNVIPPLLQAYPQEMRGLFFGLVAASVYIPWRMMPRHSPAMLGLLLASAVATFLLLGAQAEPWVEPGTVAVAADAEGRLPTLAELAQHERSVLTPREWFAALDGPTQAAILAANPQAGQDAAAPAAANGSNGFYDELAVPAGLTLTVQRPVLAYALICGGVAICAMLLPGISGSFILVMFGMYYVVTNTLRGTLHAGIDWLRGQTAMPWEHLALVAVFSLGAVVGLVIFSRLLSWLLRHAARPTLATLAGLMLGSLGVLWPFKAETATGLDAPNVWPSDWSTAATWLPLGLMLVGAALVVALDWLGHHVVPTRDPLTQRLETGDARQFATPAAKRPAATETDGRYVGSDARPG